MNLSGAKRSTPPTRMNRKLPSTKGRYVNISLFLSPSSPRCKTFLRSARKAAIWLQDTEIFANELSSDAEEQTAGQPVREVPSLNVLPDTQSVPYRPFHRFAWSRLFRF